MSNRTIPPADLRTNRASASLTRPLSNAPWASRARWHGERLARDGVALTDDIVGRLARHEGADATVAATSDFASRLRAAYGSSPHRVVVPVGASSEASAVRRVEGRKRAAKRREPWCRDCGEQGELTGHMGCQYPQDRE